jgi:hypothetical protein
MAKPSSIPVEKRRSNTKRAIMPTRISFILPLPDSHDIEQEYGALEKATDAHPIGYRVDRELNSGGHFS